MLIAFLVDVQGIIFFQVYKNAAINQGIVFGMIHGVTHRQNYSMGLTNLAIETETIDL